MPKFELVAEKTAEEVVTARDFIAIPVLGGDTTRLREVLAEMGKRGGTCLVLIADLNPDENGNDMPLPTTTRETKGGGQSTSVVYAQSTDLFSGINDDGGSILATAKLRRKVSGGSEPEADETDESEANGE